MATKPASPPGPSKAAPKREHQYQHYIPQFLLKNFSRRYGDSDHSNSPRVKKRDPKTGIYYGDLVVNSLRLTDRFVLEECPVRRACGLENMYEDADNLLKGHGHLEKKFAVLESNVNLIYRKIVKTFNEGEEEIWLRPNEKDILCKFMFLLTLRSVQYHRKYNIDSISDYKEADKAYLEKWMKDSNLTKPIDVWLQSMETVIDMEIDPEGEWINIIQDSIYYPFSDMFVIYLDEMNMSICTPKKNDEEFLLTDNCCHVKEGRMPNCHDDTVVKHLDIASCFHKFAPISPKLMIVLRSELLSETQRETLMLKRPEQMQRQLWIETRFGNGSKSILEDLPVQKAKKTFVEEINGKMVPRVESSRKTCQRESFCFKIFKISTQHTRIINSLLVDHAYHGARIIFTQKAAFLDLLEWFLTEPCSLLDKPSQNRGVQHTAYIRTLTHFMHGEGREVKSAFPTQRDDPEQFDIQNLAEAIYLEDPNRAKDNEGLGWVKVYTILGGKPEDFKQDMAAGNIMFETWTEIVNFNYGSPEYETTRCQRLVRLLVGHSAQSNIRFWMFLKRLRIAQLNGIRAPRSVEDVTVMVREECQGAEDVIAYAHPLVSGKELNLAMFKAFNQDMIMLRGVGCGVERMGCFSLIGDPTWRTSDPSAPQGAQPKVAEVKKKKEKKSKKEKKPAQPVAPDASRSRVSAASAASSSQNQQPKAKKNVDVKKTAGASQSGTLKEETSTSALESIKECNDAKAKDGIISKDKIKLTNEIEPKADAKPKDEGKPKNEIKAKDEIKPKADDNPKVTDKPNEEIKSNNEVELKDESKSKDNAKSKVDNEPKADNRLNEPVTDDKSKDVVQPKKKKKSKKEVRSKGEGKLKVDNESKANDTLSDGDKSLSGDEPKNNKLPKEDDKSKDEDSWIRRLLTIQKPKSSFLHGYEEIKKQTGSKKRPPQSRNDVGAIRVGSASMKESHLSRLSQGWTTAVEAVARKMMMPEALIRDKKVMYAALGPPVLLVGSLISFTVSILGYILSLVCYSLGFILSHFAHLIIWLLDGLAMGLNGLRFGFFPLGTYMLCAGLVLGVTFVGLVKIRRIF